MGDASSRFNIIILLPRPMLEAGLGSLQLDLIRLHNNKWPTDAVNDLIPCLKFTLTSQLTWLRYLPPVRRVE